MKTLSVFLISLCLLFVPMQASSQASTHNVVLKWTLSTDDTAVNCPVGAACSQNVYRASGNCSSSVNFQPLSINMSGTWVTAAVPPTPPSSTFTDTGVTPGVWCYAISFVFNGAESPKVSAQALIIPAAPSSLVIVAN